MYEVKDGPRTLQFNGRKLAASSSWRPGSERWVEFELYKTESGSYILSRVGVSVIYHAASCPLVRRYDLKDKPVTELTSDAVPCAECRPTRQAPIVFPEKVRTWAQVSDAPEPVLDALYKYDQGGARYLTKVAQRLLERAAEVDPGIDQVYKVEYIA